MKEFVGLCRSAEGLKTGFFSLKSSLSRVIYFRKEKHVLSLLKILSDTVNISVIIILPDICGDFGECHCSRLSPHSPVWKSTKYGHTLQNGRIFINSLVT